MDRARATHLAPSSWMPSNVVIIIIIIIIIVVGVGALLSDARKARGRVGRGQNLVTHTIPVHRHYHHYQCRHRHHHRCHHCRHHCRHHRPHHRCHCQFPVVNSRMIATLHWVLVDNDWSYEAPRFHSAMCNVAMVLWCMEEHYKSFLKVSSQMLLCSSSVTCSISLSHENYFQ